MDEPTPDAEADLLAGLLAGLPGYSEGRYLPLMGTDVRIQVWAGPDERTVAQRAEQAALATIEELAAVFTTWQPGSELMRWRRGEREASLDEPLGQALAQAASWFELGRGSFHPSCELLRRRWLRAQDEAVVPERAELQALADGLRELPWRVDGSRVVRTGDCSGADLNAFVKGWIVDRAVEAAAAVPGVVRVGVNAGGDLRHWLAPGNPSQWRVGVEDPLRPSDDGAHRLCVVALRDGAIATSSVARRGFRVGKQWFGHLVDPRTGWPVEHVGQVTVVADEAGTADALATICGVLPTDEALAFVEGQPAQCLLVTPTGQQHASSGWAQLLA